MIKKAKHSVIQSTKEILGGEPVFKGTRVPVRTFIEYLEAGDRLEDFLRDYPTVTKKQAIEVLELAKQGIIASPTNTYEDIKSLIPNLLKRLQSSNLGRVTRIS